MKRYELEAMAKADLQEHATVAGVKFSPDDTKGTLIDRIMGDIPPAVDEPEKPAKVLKDDGKAKEPPLGGLHTLQGERVNGKKYKLTIFASQGDSSDVPLIVNGHNLIVQRGKEVVVEEPYIELLRNAVIHTVVQDPDTGVRQPQQVMVYPHSAVPV